MTEKIVRIATGGNAVRIITRNPDHIQIITKPSNLTQEPIQPRKEIPETISATDKHEAESDTIECAVVPDSDVVPAPFPKEKRDHQTNHPECRQKHALEWSTLFAAVAAAVFNGLLWHSANENFRIDQRAWTFINHASIFNSTNPPLIEVSSSIKNFGKTPALRMKAFVAASTNDMAAQSNCAPRTILNDMGPFSPNEDRQSAFPLTDATAKHWISGNKLYFSGRIEYEDIFGSRHWSTFCVEAIGGDTTFHVSAFGNDSDDSGTLIPK